MQRIMTKITAWAHTFVPAPVTVSKREMFYSSIGAWLGLLGAYWFSQHILGGFNIWFVAPMGASAVLLFAVPSSPLSQPWAIIGGNLVAALVGVACAKLIPDVGLAASIAVALAIAGMFALRCLHPPSGAIALTAVLGGPAITKLGFSFVLWPVAINSFLLLFAALLFNAAVRRRYPHRAMAQSNTHLTKDVLPSERLGFTSKDLDDALADRGELLDISKEDLEEIFMQAEHRAYRRLFGEVRCEDVMSKDVVTVTPTTPSHWAWQLMIHHGVKALPVVDEHKVLLGIVTMYDFFIRQGAGKVVESRHNLPSTEVDFPVKDIMSKEVLTAQPAQLMVDLVPLFSDGGRHHLPIVNSQRQLLGMVTQSDMVAMLFRTSLESGAR